MPTHIVKHTGTCLQVFPSRSLSLHTSWALFFHMSEKLPSCEARTSAQHWWLLRLLLRSGKSSAKLTAWSEVCEQELHYSILSMHAGIYVGTSSF